MSRAAEARASRDAAVRWLSATGIRGADGSYRSIYSSVEGRHLCWYDNDTCALSTAGAVRALDAVAASDLALESAERILELMIEDSDGPGGAILSGRGSSRVFSNWVFSAAEAFLVVHSRTSEDRWLDAAARAGDFVIDKMQNRDGSFGQNLSLGPWGRLKGPWILPRQTWLANGVDVLLTLTERTGEDRFRKAAGRFMGWLTNLQSSDGSVPMFRHTWRSRLVAATVQLEPRRLFRPCSEQHPTSQAHALKALFLTGRKEAARRASEWLASQLGPNGLAYERYRPSGHSREEDVMPTALFGMILLEHPELETRPNTVERILAGILYAQIDSSDRQAQGGMRGLPRHERLGEDAYCWDTAHSILFLDRYLKTRCGEAIQP